MVTTNHSTTMFLTLVFVINCCGANADTAKRDAFYSKVGTLSLALDPRDYIFPSKSPKSNEYHDSNMDMMGELTIFFFKKDLTTPVHVILASSYDKSYVVQFVINSNYAVLTDANVGDKNFNYVREDGKMMRFYACFLGQLCPKNNVNVKYPLNKFKIKTNNDKSLLRIFVKGFYFDMNIEEPKSVMGVMQNGKFGLEYPITVSMGVRKLYTCVVNLRSFVDIEMKGFTRGPKKLSFIRVRGPNNLRVHIFTLEFAVILTFKDADMILDDIQYFLIADKIEGVASFSIHGFELCSCSLVN